MPAASLSRRGALGLILVTAAALAACAPSNSGKDSGPAPVGAEVSPPPIPDRRVDKSPDALIAILAPLSASERRLQEIAQGIVDAAELAVTDVNDPRIRVRHYDTGGDATRAQQAAAAAIADGADIIVGPVFGAAAKAVGPVALLSRVNVITFSTDATAAAENVFLIGSLPQGEVARILRYASSQGMITVGALAPDGPYGDQVIAAMRDAAPGAGMSVAEVGRYGRTFEEIQTAAKSYAVGNAFSNAPDAILLPDGGFGLQTAASFLSYFDAGPPNAVFLGTGQWNDATTLREATLRGGLFPAPDPTVRALFRERYRTVYGIEPPTLAELGYDAIAAVGAMLAFADPGSDPFDAAAITDPRGFDGVTGVFRFTPDGLNERGYAVLEVTGESFVVRDPAPKDFTGAGY